MQKEINLAEIIKGCIRQDVNCQEALYKWCYAPMLKLCKRYCHNEQDAASLFNEAMLKVFKGIANYKDSSQLTGWIKTIVINTCIDKVRLKTTFNHKEIKDAEIFSIVDDMNVYSNIHTKEILELIKELPGNTGLVFNLYAIEGYKHEEIAALLNIPLGTSKWYLSEARRLLRNKLEQSFQKANVYYGK